MNFLDILMIILGIGIFTGSIFALIWGYHEEESLGIGLLLALLVLCFEFIPIWYFLVIDKSSGSTVGTITNVDKNFFGTTSLYIKTSENSQEQYCMENEDIVNLAKEMLGKEVKISYDERVGLYSTNKCHSAPVDRIEALNEC